MGALKNFDSILNEKRLQKHQKKTEKKIYHSWNTIYPDNVEGWDDK